MTLRATWFSLRARGFPCALPLGAQRRHLAQALRALGFEPKNEEILEMFPDVDDEGSGSIEYDLS